MAIRTARHAIDGLPARYRAMGSLFSTALMLALIGAPLVQNTAAAQESQAISTEREPVLLSQTELQTLIGPVALYPDDLLSILLPATTYPLQIVQAARFLDALEADPELEPDPDWDDAVVALLNYPEVLRMLNDDLDWTWSLGEAVLSQQADVIDAIQDFREQAYFAGNLESDERQLVSRDNANGVIAIEPADPEVIYVPYYEPTRVVVVQAAPVIRYYNRRYPVYYYPYPSGYSFASGYFWGVSSAFSIGWDTHNVLIYPHSHLYHPYYSHVYYAPHYVRYGYGVDVNLNYVSHVWYPSERRGPRPRYDAPASRQVTVTNEGYTRNRGSSSTTTTTVRERLEATRRQTDVTTRGAVVNSTTTGGSVSSGSRATSSNAARTRVVTPTEAATSQSRTRVPRVEAERSAGQSTRIVNNSVGSSGATRASSSTGSVTVRDRISATRQATSPVAPSTPVTPAPRTRVEPTTVQPAPVQRAAPVAQPTPRSLATGAANRARAPATTVPRTRTTGSQR